MDEGVIKFHCDWFDKDLAVTVPADLLHWRDRMQEAGLIGVYKAINIGYGNISVMQKEGMLISGSQTGHIDQLKTEGYALVTEYSIDNNSLKCEGRVKASSESLTHLAFYEADEEIKAIVHVHHKALWESLLHKVPTSSATVPYGTPAMANEIKRLFIETNLPKRKLMAMAGHEEGLIAFGTTLKEAANLLLNALSDLKGAV